MRTTPPARIALCGTLLSLACATSPRGPGRLDPALGEAAHSPTARKVKLVLGKDGEVTKLSVNDTDPARVPPALRRLAEEKFPGSTLTEAEVEIYSDAGLVDEAELKTKDGRECELSMSRAGQFRYTECDVDNAAIPGPVQRALDQALPGAKVLEVEERNSADGGHDFKVEASAEGRVWYLRIQADGTLSTKKRLLAAEVRVE